MSKPLVSRGWVCAFGLVPVFVIAGAAFLMLRTQSPAKLRQAASARPALQASSTRPKAETESTGGARASITAGYGALPLAFEQNEGQTDSRVKYVARGDGYTLFLTANDAVFALRTKNPRSNSNEISRGKGLGNPAPKSAKGDSGALLHMRLTGAKFAAKVSASDLMPGKSNYFLGNDPSQWHANVPHYARVSYQDVYPGVNLIFHGAQRQTEFDFVVAPQADASSIAFHFSGARALKTDDSGNLLVSSSAGDVELHKPVAYQQQDGARQPVDANFVVRAGNQISFALGNYDHSRVLIIDPSVSYGYSTFLGGSGDDEGHSIAIDANGNAYITGQTASANFPVAGGSSALHDAASAFVTKIAADGSSLVYSTYIGGTGSGIDAGNGIAVDASGDAFITGSTSSNNFPVLAGAYQPSLLGSYNAFILELNPSGTPVYSTYLGGTGLDKGIGIALATDGSGDVFVAGTTSSNDFPTLAPLQAYIAGSVSSGFVTKLNSSGTGLVYSTYLGGSTTTGDFDGANAVAVDSSNNAYITGITFSTTFPTTTGAYQTACGGCSNGSSNAYISIINPGGSALVYSTYVGGNGNDEGTGIAVDASGAAYITGSTTSSNFPHTAGSFGGVTDAFVTKVTPSGKGTSDLAYSIFLGGAALDSAGGIALDGNNNAYVTGVTSSTTGFTLVNPTQATFGGGSSDAFVSEVGSTGTVVFSTYLGGSQTENVSNLDAIAVDSAGGSIYVTGNTAITSGSNNNFFTSGSAFQKTTGGATDAFVTSYTQVTFDLSATTPAAVNPGSSATSTVTLTGVNGYSSPVNLTCTVTGSGSPLPSCSAASSFSPASPVTPTSSGATTTLTITTTGSSAANLAPGGMAPVNLGPGKFLYGIWLPVAGLSLLGISFGSGRPARKRKLLGLLLLGLVMAALITMPACGGSSSSTGGGGGGGGGTATPAGSYTVTITGTGTDTTSTVQTAQVVLTVN